MNEELISVVMSVYNEPESMIKESIDSIIAQTYSNLEIIIVDDNPNEEKISKIIENFAKKDRRIRIIYNKKNLGLALSLNRGLKTATGKYIARMDADDISDKNRLFEELKFLNDYNFDMVFTERYNINEEGNIIKKITYPSYSSQDIKTILPLDCIVTHPSVLIKKQVIDTLGGYRKFDVSQDYDLWLRLVSNNYNIGLLNKPLIYYRIRVNAISSQKSYMQFVTAKYIRQLYAERLSNNNVDSYTYDNYIEYLKSNDVFDSKISDKYLITSKSFYDFLDCVKSKSYPKAFNYLIHSFAGFKWNAYTLNRILKLKNAKRRACEQ